MLEECQFGTVLCSKMCRQQSRRSSAVRPAVSNAVTETPKQTTQEEAVFFDLCSPSVWFVLHRTLDDSGLLPPYRHRYACSVCTAGHGLGIFICIHVLKWGTSRSLRGHVSVGQGQSAPQIVFNPVAILWCCRLNSKWIEMYFLSTISTQNTAWWHI